MKASTKLSGLLFSMLLTSAANAVLIQVGDLNVISDTGNVSDGLRYLDMTYSDGLTSAAALANAQLNYVNARLATRSEFDHLFAAAGIGYDTGSTVVDLLGNEEPVIFSSGSNYDGGALAAALGVTNDSDTYLWDPDGPFDITSSNDYVYMGSSSAGVYQSSDTPPHPFLGWLIVSEVPEASTGLLSLVGIGAVALRRSRK